MKVVFIDRDGVINKDPGGWTKHDYVTRWEDFHFLPGALQALKKLNKAGLRVIVISNQAGVGKGYFTRQELNGLTDRMVKDAAKAGGRIEQAYYCIHKSDDNCNCRKPKSGLLETAQKEFDIEMHSSYFIGDTETDVMAGRLAGCRTVAVLSGKATAEDIKKWTAKPDYVFNDLLGAVEWLVRKETRRAKRAIGRAR